MERALLWLHEQEVASLGKGLTVFRQAINSAPRIRRVASLPKSHFQPLEEHYAEQTTQTHVMSTYAERGLVAMHEAVRLSEDYFVLDRDTFARRWMPGRSKETSRQTTGRSWKSIVEVSGQPGAAGDRGRRSHTNQCAGPCWARLRQDARPGASHRLPRAGAEGGSTRHPGAHLQPPRGSGDPVSPTPACSG